MARTAAEKGLNSFLLETEAGIIKFGIRKTKNGFFISQFPVVHGIRKGITFDSLFGILSKGFKGTGLKNVEGLDSLRQRGSDWALPDRTRSSFLKKLLGLKTERITEGDRYSIELFSPIQAGSIGFAFGGKEKIGSVLSASPEQISKVYIDLRQAKEDKLERKKSFYRRVIQQGFGIPVEFILRGQ